MSVCSSKRGHSQSASHTPQSSTPFVHPVAFHTGRRVSLCVKGLLKVHVSKARSAYCDGKNIDFYIMCVELMCGFFLTFDRNWLNRKVFCAFNLSDALAAQCPANEERTSSSGVILSPGFPSNYPNSQTCSWLLHMIPGRGKHSMQQYFLTAVIFSLCVHAT